MRHMITLKNWNAEDMRQIIEKAIEIKNNPEKYLDVLKGKTLIMLFQKTSTRTRLSFETGMTQLGGHAIFLDNRTSQFSLTDFKDEINAVMRLGDILMFRALRASDVITAAELNKIPVIDGCSEKYHPCQTLGDIMTMAEVTGGIDNIKKIAWLGIQNNVSNTLKLACAKLGIKVSILAPEIHEISVDEEINEIAEKTGMIKETLDMKEGLEGVRFVHTDTWMDMEFFKDGKIKEGYEELLEKRKKLFMPYQVNKELIETYCPDAKIMHCMPCHIGYEITRDAIDSSNAVIFDQAENRLHIQKAIILKLLETN